MARGAYSDNRTNVRVFQDHHRHRDSRIPSYHLPPSPSQPSTYHPLANHPSPSPSTSPSSPPHSPPNPSSPSTDDDDRDNTMPLVVYASVSVGVLLVIGVGAVAFMWWRRTVPPSIDTTRIRIYTEPTEPIKKTSRPARTVPTNSATTTRVPSTRRGRNV